MYAYEEPRLTQAFISAYLAHRLPRAGFARRFPVYLLRDCLHLWVFCLRRNAIWWPAGMTLRGWVQETLALLRENGCLPSEG